MDVVRKLLLMVSLAAGVQGIEISPLETGRAAAEGACRLTGRAASVDARDAQFLVKFTVRGAAPGDTVRVEWVDPAGQAVERAEYANLPAGRAVCVIHALQVGGFAPGTRPGRWRVRVIAGGQVARESGFDIVGRPSPLSVRVAEAGPGGLVWRAGVEQ